MIYTVANCGSLAPAENTGHDPRGVLWLFERPRPNANYFMGVDAAVGIIGWDRLCRTQNDYKTDNGVIEVVRRGINGAPDCQAAEYAGPIDPEALADRANLLGRLYGGNDESGQALACVEVYPGPGGLTQQRLIHRYGYTNLWVPRYVNVLAGQGPRNVVGFTSSSNSRRDLWLRGKKHIINGGIVLNSPWLIEEMADCQPDDWRLNETARAKYGKHDDRVISMFLALLAAHDWSWEIETRQEKVEVGGPVNWQASDIGAEAMLEAWEDRWEQLTEA